MSTAISLRDSLLALANPEIAEHSLRFFKTGQGEYGEGDQFIGIRVPQLRQLAKDFKAMPLVSVLVSLKSPYHEERLCALFIMVLQFTKAKPDPETQRSIFEAYLAHTEYINGWDLVDSSSHKILGPYLLDKPRHVLYQLAVSESLWERRIAMMTTYHFIKRDDFEDALRLAAVLRDDNEDLIHKVVGWMLREVGKRNWVAEQNFLKQHYKLMPRTMLRYAIEKLPKEDRKRYLDGEI